MRRSTGDGLQQAMENLHKHGRNKTEAGRRYWKAGLGW